MKLIEPKVELIQQEPGLVGMYKHIERCARTCYKSEDKITEDSYKKMYDNLVQRRHLAMLEHGTVYLIIPEIWSPLLSLSFKEEFGQFSKVFMVCNDLYITTNLRVIIENKLEKYLKYLCEPTKFHEKRITLKFTTNIGVTREANRHRTFPQPEEFSVAEESTRYCNYTSNKFGNHITCCKPVWIAKDDVSPNVEEYNQPALDNLIKEYGTDKEHCWIDIDYYLFSLLTANYCYNNLIRLGWSPQQAREVLPLATKSEVVYTAFTSDWKHWFDLRLLGTTGKPHSNMKEIAELAQQELIKNNLWELIYSDNKHE